MSYGLSDQGDLYRISVIDYLSVFANKNYRYKTAIYRFESKLMRFS